MFFLNETTENIEVRVSLGNNRDLIKGVDIINQLLISPKVFFHLLKLISYQVGGGF